MLSIFVFLLLQEKAIFQKIEVNADQKALCLLASSKKLSNMLGRFVPVCDDNGDFRPKQCSVSQGQCWCVDPKTGLEIEGSRKGPGKFLDCSGNSKRSCRDELMDVLKKGVELDTFVPSCINNGLYSSNQCHESIGQCWCVNVDTGAEIAGTRTKFGPETTIDCLRYEKVRCPNGQPLEERDCSMNNPCPTGFTCHLITLSPEKAACCPASENATIEPRLVPQAANDLMQTDDSSEAPCKPQKTHQKSENLVTKPCFDLLKSTTTDTGNVKNYVPKCKAEAKAVANDEEIKNVGITAVVANHTKQSVNSSEMFLGTNVCKLPKNYGSYCNATKENATINKWYFNSDKFSCLAFTYKGCSGNDNKFDTKSQCEMRCKPQDGPTCSGYGNGLEYDNGTAPVGRNCLELQCPAGWVCKPGVFFATCCNKTVEDYFNDAYNETCPNGAKAFSIARPFWSETYFGDTCNDLRCPSGYECSQTNPLFAKCCSTVVPAANFHGLNVKSRKISHGGIPVSCPVGEPFIDEVSSKIVLCNGENQCPNRAFCWNGYEIERKDSNGICCLHMNKVPKTIQRKLASQNCSEQVQRQLQLCAAKANLTNANQSPDQANQSSTSTFNPASILFKAHSSSSTDNKLISLNQTCKSYDFYLSCVDDVFRDPTVRKSGDDPQDRRCYSYVNDVLGTLMGFFCEPSRKSLLEKNRSCLSEILKKEATKNCLNVFEQSSRVRKSSSSGGTSNGGSSSTNSDQQMEFGNLCYAIRYFGDCLGPAVAKNCSADLDFTIRQYVNESLSVIFGGTCEQVSLESEEGEESGTGANAVGHNEERRGATKKDSRRTKIEGATAESSCRDDVDLMDGISACWKKFTDSSAANSFFKSSRNNSQIFTLTVEQIDNLEEMCALFQSFDRCTVNLSKSKSLCDTSIVLANVKSAVEPYCRPPGNVASWKRYGPCLVDALDAPSARLCRKERGSSCSDDQTADFFACAKNSVNSICGSAAAEFYGKFCAANGSMFAKLC